MKYVSEMFLVFIAINSGVMYFHLDKVILANDNNIADVSFYGLGERIILLLVTLMTAAISFLTPKLSNLRVVGQESLNLLNHNYRLVLLLLCPACVGIYVIGDEFINLFAGVEYERATVLIPFVSLILFVYTLLEFLKTNVYIVFKFEYVYALAFFLGLLLNFVIKIFVYSLDLKTFMGVLFAILLIKLFSLFFIAKRKLGVSVNHKYVLVYLTLCLPMVLVKLIQTGSTIQDLSLKIAICTVYYILVLLLVKDRLVEKLIYSIR